jgi:hypothetical protein
MKIHEVKLRLNSSINKLIDTYFGLPTVTEKMVNATLKIIAKQNMYKLDTILEMFADQNGEIDPQAILYEYANQIDENGIRIDIKNYIDNDLIKQILPNKILIIKKEDIMSLIV